MISKIAYTERVGGFVDTTEGELGPKENHINPYNRFSLLSISREFISLIYLSPEELPAEVIPQKSQSSMPTQASQ